MDIETQLRDYAARRVGGKSFRAHEMVLVAVSLYNATIKVLKKHGSFSRQFWEATESLSASLDDILSDFPGNADYYFGARQYDELVLPALKGISGRNSHFTLPQQMMIVGDWLIHVHCDTLSEEQQRAGMREILRILDLLQPSDQVVPQLRFTVVHGLAKLLFIRTQRDSTREANDREFFPALAVEAAKWGMLKLVLRMLTKPFSPLLLPGIQPLDPLYRDRTDLPLAYMGQRMAESLVAAGDVPTAAKVARWASGQPQVVEMLVGKLRRGRTQIVPPMAMSTLRLIGCLSSISPPLLEALAGEGLHQALLELRSNVERALSDEVDSWLQRLFSPTGRQRSVVVQQAQQDSRQQGQGRQLTREELSAFPIRELKALLQEAGADFSNCREKQELIQLALATRAAGAAGGAGAGEDSGAELSAQQQLQAQQAQQQQQQQQQAQQQPRCKEVIKSCGCCGTQKGSGVKLKLCSGCKRVYFCSEVCQRQMWPQHKAACKAVQAAIGRSLS